jgi:hypothetical protein
MLRLTNTVPKYRKHKQSGQAIITLNGRDYLLGPHGTRASKIEYDRLIGEWLQHGRQLQGSYCRVRVYSAVSAGQQAAGENDSRQHES